MNKKLGPRTAAIMIMQLGRADPQRDPRTVGASLAVVVVVAKMRMKLWEVT